ncbi:hypothetical protein EDD15DRAFT_2366590 [Pisolithus albus]|nr:hypothetical protein EDD15DRAFT_2366590 [Pisolithus albus]
MPVCPKCLKYFETARSLTFHRAQLRAACNVRDGWDTEIVSTTPANERNNHDVDDVPVASFPSDSGHAMDFDPGLAWEGNDNRRSLSPPISVPVDSLGRVLVTFPRAAEIFEGGETFLTRFELDPYSVCRRLVPFYPFANLDDWRVANFLLTSGLSMRALDEFLSLQATKNMPLSFWTAKDLRARAELLPSGPRWKFQIVPTTHSTKEPIQLYFRDALDCVEALFNHPFFEDKMDFTPFRLFTTAERVVRVFTEWMSSDGAWDMQSKIPEGGTVCGVILSSDKTNITNMCGGRVAHPLLISLANIKMKVRNKASSHAFLLLALMPIPQFIHPVPRMCSVLQERLFHQCLDIVLEPLKQAARFGRMMSDPVRNLRYCFTHLVSYIVDTPEARMLACVRGNTSPVTTAMYKDFGDPYRHPPRTATTTLAQLSSIECDVLNVDQYFAACEPFRLSGVSHPFWRDWLLAEPSEFLTPESLHEWHRQFWDHDVRWCKQALGAAELDFRFSIIPRITGIPHFSNGITKLKQVGGRVQRDVQRYIIVVITGATDPDVIIAIRALMEFRYLSQATAITSTTRDKIRASLQEFHDHKDALIENGFRRGEKTKHVLKHWHIPKLELMQSVVPSVERVGSILQWSADTTEHAHIEVIKDPASTTNNHNYDSQICRCLDRYEKCRLFDTALALHGSTTESIPVPPVGQDADGNDSDTYDGDECRNVLDDIWTPKRKVTNFFDVAARLLAALPGSVPRPPRTFIAGSTAIRLNYDPSLKRIPIDTVAEQFGLPDLRGALGDYLNREGNVAQNFHTFGGQRRSPPDVHLPFKELDVWYKVRLQQKTYHDSSEITPTFTVHAHPPDRSLKYGRYDAAIMNIDDRWQWPSSGLQGHTVVQVRLIMCPAAPRGSNGINHFSSRFLMYAQRFDIVPQGNSSVERTTGLHVLKRATRASGSELGEIFPLDQLRSYAHIVPRFGRKADNRLTSDNCIHSSQSFFLNRYFDKDFFYATS